MRSVALRIVNDVSCVTDINHESHFAWQAQYLVRLEDESCLLCALYYRLVLEYYFVVQSSTGVVLCSAE